MKKISIAATIFFLIISAFTPAAGQSKQKGDESFIVPLGKGISLSLTASRFEPNAHKITKCKILNWQGICLIDGKPAFGTDWGVPKKQLTRAVLKIADVAINLDVSCMFDPWLGPPQPENFVFEEVEGGYLLRGSFSDGAGSYEAEWLIINNASVRTRIGKTEC
jgi:hypothetical protein